MYTIAQVIEGLKKGQSFERDLADDGDGFTGHEAVSPSDEGLFLHFVSGFSHGEGFGGESILEIEQLSNGRFASEGWKSHTL